MDLSSAFEKHGLIYLGHSGTEPGEHFQHYLDWLQSGKQGEMAYLEKHLEIRKDPKKLLPGVQSVILFALPYYLGDRLIQIKNGKTATLRIAQYARLKDYHKSMKELAGRVVEDLRRDLPEKFSSMNYRITVDSAPVMERAFASLAGQGFLGKNTCYIHFEKGSFLLLGEIFSNLTFEGPRPIPQKAPAASPCGSCNRCQVHCPTGALSEDFKLDSRRCLAYWTIEHRGTIPEEFWPHLKEYIFGCDLCQLVCPFNLPSRSPRPPQSLEIRSFPPLYEIATMDQRSYEDYFGGTPLTRAKRNGLRRNALIALAVTQDPRLAEALHIAERDGGYPIDETVAQIRRYVGKTLKLGSESFAT